MEQKKIIFKNSQTNINEGYNFGEGILYCGKKYTNPDGCECGNCDGYCGPDNGCACPDCEYTLSYLLYLTNKMICEKCKKNLIRIKICNLLLLLSNNKEIKFIICKKCKKQYEYNFIQVLHCFKCNYTICSKCAFSNISTMNNIKIKKNEIFDYKNCKFSPMNLGTIYCGKKYVKEGFCLCGNCDGSCGPDNGCPCSMCSAVLGYNIYLYYNKNDNKFFKCVNDGNLLIKSNNFEYNIIKEKKNKKNNFNDDKIKSFFCNKCNSIKKNDSYSIVYYCSKCLYCICHHCIYYEIREINFVVPEEPMILSWNNLITNEKFSYEKIEKLIINEYLNNKKKLNSLNNEINLFIPKKREKPQNTKNVNLYLKTMNGNIFTINIDNGETIKTLKNELNKMDNNLKTDKINLLYKKQMLKNYNFICDYELEDNSIILIIKI